MVMFLVIVFRTVWKLYCAYSTVKPKMFKELTLDITNLEAK